MELDVFYVVITPVKNEAQFIEKTLSSMIAQTIKPAEWLIVNDGSTDGTHEIIEAYAKKHTWIRLVDRNDRGFRELGKGVVESFYEGYAQLTQRDFDFIVKLDADLSFEPNYFEEVFKRFKEDRRLGIASGSCYVPTRGKLVLEKTPRTHTRGPTKIYRRETWHDIGGLVPSLGWDTIDEVKAQMHGWRTRSFNELAVIHYRPTGYADGAIKGRVKQGLGAYYVGYSPIFMGVRVARQMADRPYIIGGLAMLWGFMGGYLTGFERHKDFRVIQFLRKQQITRLKFWMKHNGDRAEG